MVSPQPLERALDLLEGERTCPLTGLGGQEELVAVSVHPGPEAQLGFAVTGGGVDVVDPMRTDQFHGLIRLFLADVADGGGAKEKTSALMASTAERLNGDHGLILPCYESRRSASRTGIWRLVLS